MLAEGYAQACAEAVSKIAASMQFGRDHACNCDVSAAAYANATAHEVETIFALMKQVRCMPVFCMSGIGGAQPCVNMLHAAVLAVPISATEIGLQP